jgi:hypothetical protein
MTEHQLQAILSHMRTKYRALDDPNYLFVVKAQHQKPYRDVIHALENQFDITEDTDLNVGVSFGYTLREGDTIWSLELSMVGPYAAIWRILVPGQELQVIDPNTKGLSTTESSLMRVLHTFSILVLDQASLEQQIPLNLSTIELEDTRIYQALFCQLDPLPWG